MYDIKSDNKIKISTSITIDAKPEKVWAVLADTENWQNWTPTIGSFKGDFKKNGNIIVTFNTPEGQTPFKRKLVIFEKNKVFCWEGDAMIPGYKDHHVFHLEETEDGKTLYTQADGFHGTERTPEIEEIEGLIKKMYVYMNEDLKKYIENK